MNKEKLIESAIVNADWSKVFMKKDAHTREQSNETRDDIGHAMLDGRPIHQADGRYFRRWMKGGFMYEDCHCLKCGIRMSRPVRKTL